MGRYKEFKRQGLTAAQNEYYVSRRKMVEDQIMPRGIKNERVLKAMSTIPRHLFVPEALQEQAYSDYPVNIGEGQTISQPLMVALMTELLEPKKTDRILEIGTGSGYQAAVLCELVKHVYTIERIRSLANRARKVLYDIGMMNFTMRVGDGTKGWPEEAPFDGIIVTAGAPVVPESLVNQLQDGGRLVIPVGDAEVQKLLIIKRVGNGFEQVIHTGCRFVPLIGEQGWKE